LELNIIVVYETGISESFYTYNSLDLFEM
jgi:hypothetical protein